LIQEYFGFVSDMIDDILEETGSGTGDAGRNFDVGGPAARNKQSELAEVRLFHTIGEHPPNCEHTSSMEIL
jgi:hypothetical protein